MKKVLSLVLVIAMVLSSMSFAFASTFEDVTNDYEKAIDTLAGLGVVTGYEDGTYRPEKVVTRAEMAKLMVEILGYGDLVAGAKSNFTDTQGHWADAYIAIAAGRNIVIGDGNGKFRPDATVTYNEVLTMVVRGLGYTDDSNEIKSMTWPTNFKVKAAEIGVTEGVKMNTTGADRGGVAQALYNALEATLVTVDNEGNVKALQDKKQRDLLLITRIAIPVGDEDAPLRIVPEMLDADSKEYAGDVIDLEAYLYEYVEAYASKADNDIIVYVAESFSDTVEGTFKANDPSGATTDNSKVAVKLADTTTKVLDLTSTSDAIEVYYNGKEVIMNETELEDGTASLVSLAGTGVADVKVVLKDRYNDDVVSSQDGDVKAIVVSNPTTAQKAVAAYKDGALKLGRIQLPKKGSSVDLTKVTVTGAVEDIKDIKAGDVVVAYAAGGNDNSVVPSETTLVVVRETVEGVITKVNKSNDGSTTIYVDGTKFTRSEIPGRTETFDVGYEGTFFLDDAGRLFAADATDMASAKDYAVVIEKVAGVRSETDGVAGITSADRIIANAEIKLINAAGDVVTYKVDKDAKYQVNGVATTNVLNINTLAFLNTYGTITSRTLIKYNLDGDVIDSIEVVEIDAADNAGTGYLGSRDTDSAKFEVANDAPIFSVKATAGTDKADYSVVKAENLPNSINITYADYTDGGQYKVIVATNADRSLSGTYALITGINYVMDGNKKVAEMTGLVDGKEVTYLAKSALTIPTTQVDAGVIFDLTMSGGKVESLTVENPNVAVTPSAIYASAVAGTRMNLKFVDDNTDWTNVELNYDNLTIYVLNADDEFDYVETSAKNIVGFEVVGLYDLDGVASTVELVVVK